MGINFLTMEMSLVLFRLRGNGFGGWRDFFFSLFYDNDASMILSIYFQAICNVGPGY